MEIVKIENPQKRYYCDDCREELDQYTMNGSGLGLVCTNPDCFEYNELTTLLLVN